MRILTRPSLFSLSKQATNKIPLSLGYPFEYTLNTNDFIFYDVRFTEVAFGRELHKPERQHVRSVLKYFENVLNGEVKMKSEAEDFVLKALGRKAEELRDIASESEFKLTFNFDLDSAVKSSGYYEIKTEGNFSLDEKDIEQIHNYTFLRDKEELKVWIKQKKVELSPEEQLKKDIMDKMGNPGKDLRQQFQKMKISKQATFYNKMVDGFLSIGKKEKKSTKFQPYFIIDQIKGTFSCDFLHDGLQYREEELEFDTKWLYKVTNLQSEDLKRYRKRTLFDFQFWQRGNFFPIRNFAQEIKDLE